jgi:hypothetical protein
VRRPVFRAPHAIFRARLPDFCHDPGMGQLLSHMPFAAGRGPRLPETRRGQDDRGAAARGILLALALSSLVWIALALTVPRLW